MNMNQMQLFDEMNYSHKEEPITEQELEAWRKLDINPDIAQLRVLHSLASFEDGATSMNISADTGIEMSSVTPRLTQLSRFGLVKDTGIRRKSKYRPFYVWKITPFGETQIRKVKQMTSFVTDEWDDELWSDEPMTFDDYEADAMETAIYPDELIYPVLGLLSEAGELASKVKKYYRDNCYSVNCEDAVLELPFELRFELAKELGDSLWYLTAIASDLGYSLEEIAWMNVEKLQDRQERDVLTGSGDNR